MLKINEAVETKVQVLDDSGDPDTGATVNYRVYDEADGQFTSGSMSHIAYGIYSVSWTPDTAGEWTFYAYCSDPKFHKTFTYFVEKGMEQLVEEIRNQVFTRRYPFETESDSVSSASETALTNPTTVTVTFPTNSTLLSAAVVAIIKANNQSANAHDVGVTLQKNIAGGGWTDIRDLTTSPPVTLPAVDGENDSLILVENVTGIDTGETVTFRWQVDSNDANEVHYTSTFVLIVQYDFSGA